MELEEGLLKMIKGFEEKGGVDEREMFSEEAKRKGFYYRRL